MLALSDVEINAWVSVFVWPFARIVGLFLTEPIFAYRGVPRTFKAGFALMLTVLLAPLLPPLPAVPLVSAEGIAILLQQLLIGLAMGFVMRLVITSVEIAGFIIGAQTGLGFAMFFDPVHAAQVPVVSQMLSLFTFFLFLSFDGHHVVLHTLVESFRVLPIGMGMPAQGIKALALWGAHMLEWGIRLTMPVIGALLITNLAIGVMTRAAPQFNIFTFGFPLTIMIGFGTLYLTLPMMVPVIEQMYRAGFEMMLRMLQAK
ncbi:flagellar biosynthetic protein FliR [Chromobacterium amazonense]|uniref:Flagellar biosynthetic protein FliR n=1 Tax=Chromobacterium amazonense TaxID=1382803 RepID=A0A2S9X359_9NEIS|nr:flagellar biosynthetic protein FliR [Chromobacterium amazonense]KIA79472.1 flagellar biosynthesis protein FliR [Chromobacterium piscinae]MBM2884417.1 flagellar biosynthetic protein FliR [Chromobacterium amazonense]MDE1711251.1 flagellar biosynthetic protein FliR [Chromobacterium amazonense]MDQ4539365.1 flagellar biosynthetic protein FliR [Chromobacterium amazonense]PRP70169.1 flagellar biosynthetic protein FliR [Chromobacterium amazonense]